MNKQYIELLEEYRNGSISDSDRHILERAALDDPMLFDAIEGYTTQGSKLDSSNISDLKTLSNTNRSSSLKWLNRRTLTVAASLIALIAITFVMRNQLSRNENSTTAVAQSKHQDNQNNEVLAENGLETSSNTKSTAAIDLENSQNFSDKKGDSENKIKVYATQNYKTDTSDKETSNINEIPIVQPSVKSYRVVEPELKQETAAINKAISKRKSTVSKAAKESSTDMMVEDEVASLPSASRIAESKVSSSENISGVILSETGDPLLGSTIEIENTSISTVSDDKGIFNITKYPEGHRILVKHDGYHSRRILISNRDYYEIVLDSKSDLAEPSNTKVNKVDKRKAFPRMGMDEFKVMIDINKDIPLEVFGSHNTVKVTVGFQVNRDGSLSRFRDETQNKCNECYLECVQLLLKSGKWNTKPANKVYRTSYDFEF